MLASVAGSGKLRKLLKVSRVKTEMKESREEPSILMIYSVNNMPYHPLKTVIPMKISAVES